MSERIEVFVHGDGNYAIPRAQRRITARDRTPALRSMYIDDAVPNARRYDFADRQNAQISITLNVPQSLDEDPVFTVSANNAYPEDIINAIKFVASNELHIAEMLENFRTPSAK